MPAKHHIDNKAKLIITTWEGEAVDIEFIEAIKKYQNNIQNNKNYENFNEIVNLTKVTSMKLTTDGIKSVGIIASSTDSNKSSKKLAIIANSKLVFGISRMYEAYRSFSKKTTKEVSVFKKESDALKWVKKNLGT